MKFTISSDVLNAALRSGGVAANTPDAQDAEVVRVVPTQRCVMLTANADGLTIESAVQRMSARHQIDKNSVSVTAFGAVCIDKPSLEAKSANLMTPHELTFDFAGDQEKEAGQADAILPVGKVKVSVVNAKKRKAFNWSFDAYSATDFPQIGYAAVVQPWGEFKTDTVYKAVDAVGFALANKDHSDLFDNVAIMPKDKSAFVACTDNRHCAVCKMDQGGVLSLPASERLLVPFALFRLALDSVRDGLEDSIALSIEEDNEHLVVAGVRTTVRMAMPASNTRSKFPDVMLVYGMKAVVKIEIPSKAEFTQAVTTIVKSKDAPEWSKYIVETGKDELKLAYFGDEVASVGCNPIAQGLAGEGILLSNDFMLNVLKRLAGDIVLLSFTPDEKRAKIEDPSDPSLIYLMQRAADLAAGV